MEPGWDYAYLTVSADNGATWKVLRGTADTAGQYGPAWNGQSNPDETGRNGWLTESVSLAEYTGQVVQLRFDVLTDFEDLAVGLP
ncbi:MAG: immune inhibitor A [Chloroflexota bacterium]